MQVLLGLGMACLPGEVQQFVRICVQVEQHGRKTVGEHVFPGTLAQHAGCCPDPFRAVLRDHMTPLALIGSRKQG